MISQSEENINDSINNQSKDYLKRKRRSKHDQNGRTSKCKHCEKTYLSSIALNNHVKTKHSHLLDMVSRGRGRPRKSPIEEGTANHYETRYKAFFEKPERRRNEGEEYDFNQTIKENFDNLYIKYQDSLFKYISSSDEFQLNLETKEGTCDNAFKKYLEYMHTKSNKDYFDFVYKFVVLFRESILLKKLSTGTENFPVNYSAESVPDSCNDFVGDFLENYDNFNMDMNELIEIIQHCCHWLWENGFTTSKLSLISN